MSIRISDTYIAKLLVGDMNRALATLLEHQRQAGTMRRVLDFADDPRAIAAMQRYSSLISGNDQYLRNARRSGAFLDATDAALQDISGVLAEVRALALREASAIANDTTRHGAAVDVENYIERLIDTLNTTVEDNYIFSGHRTDTAPFVRSGATVVYQGDSGAIATRVGPSTELAINIPGEVFLGTRSSLLVGSSDLAPRIDAATTLDSLSLGSGWDPGSISIRDGNDAHWTIDLSMATTVGDLAAEIATATGGAVTLDVTPDGQSLRLTGTAPLTVEEVNDGTTAESLGLRGASDASWLTGRDVRPALQSTTLLADIEALAAALPLGPVDVTVEGTTTTVDFSTATTIGDLQTLFAAAMPGFELRLQPTRLDVVGGSPVAFTVSNSGGGDTATLLGIQGDGTPIRLFGMLEDLKAALEAGDADGIRRSLPELAALEDVVYGEMIRTGGRQRDLEWSETVLLQRDERLRTHLSVERDADMAAVSAALSRAETVYQSSLLVARNLFDQNLMMYL
jgi:flagellar hook-associated protein 3 FlgL